MEVVVEEADLHHSHRLQKHLLSGYHHLVVRCVVGGPTKHYTSQCQNPAKPKTNSVEYEDEQQWGAQAGACDDQWQKYGMPEGCEASKCKKGKSKRSKSNGKSKGKGTPRPIIPRPAPNQNRRPERPLAKPKPETRSCVPDGYLFAMVSSKTNPLRDIHSGSRRTTWCAVLRSPRRSCLSSIQDMGKCQIGHWQ